MTLTTSSDGLRWEVTHGDHDSLGPSHEDGLTPRVLALIPPGGTFLDVGAQVGHYAIRAARRGAQVYAIEPNHHNVQRLADNAKLNDLTCSGPAGPPADIMVAEIAAWDGAARLRLNRTHPDYVHDGSAYCTPDESGRVFGARLDDALNQYPMRPEALDLVKIDTEGAELRVLDGMAGLLARHRPLIIAEDHAYLGRYGTDDLEMRLESLGYRPECVMYEGSAWWFARPAPLEITRD